jgi:uncharacterized membrane protein YbhN (UPF0104 family)
LNSKIIIKHAISIIVIFSIFYFFIKTLKINWTSIQSYDFNINSGYILFSFISIVINYLLFTYGWFVTLNSLSLNNKISYPQSLAVVNTSNLTKYIPGKVWSFALQMYWLSQVHFTKTTIVYVNVTNLIIAVITSLLLGFIYLVVSVSVLPITLSILCFLIILGIDILYIQFNSLVFNRVIAVVNKIFHREIKYINTPKKLLLHLHMVHLIAALFFGISAYLVSIGIGFDVASGGMYSIMSSMILADLIGYLAIIIPGGLGIREGVMYFMLKGVSTGPLALILPIATRIVSMFVDIFLGVIGFILLKNVFKIKRP